MLTRALIQHVATRPTQTAIVCGAAALTYADLAERARILRDRLSGLSIGTGDCLGVVLPNSAEFVVTFFAAARAGILFLPINPLLSPREIRRHLLECGARGLITDRNHAQLCDAVLANVDPDVALVVLDDGAPESSGPPTSDDTTHPDDPFLIQFSSGSMGRLKQVRRSARNLVEEASNFCTSAGITSEDRIFCPVPLHHAHGLGNGMLASLYAGATLFLDRLDEKPLASRAAHILQVLARERITILPGVPYLFEAMAHAPSESREDLSSVRLCFSAGTALPHATFDAFQARFGVPIRQLYGCTEAGSVALNREADVRATWDSVGTPLGSVEVHIVDERGCELPAGVEGEIVFRSRALTSGYVNAPQANQASFRDGGFVTGDLGRRDAAGRIYITGRQRRLIESGGYKIDPVEIEDVLTEYPKIAEAVVVGVDTAKQTELVKAVVVCRGSCTRAEILAHCRSRLAAFKVPAIVEFVTAIPKSPLGKILRGPLIEASATFDPSDIETRARLIVGDLLGVDCATLDRDRPLSEYGVDSIRAVELAVRLEEALHIAVPVTLLWNHSTLAAIGEVLVPGRTVGPDDVRPPDSVAADTKHIDPAAIAFDSSVVEEVARLSDEEVRRLLSADTR
jgi:long-chain acyl-CoA synthetase